MHFKRVLPFVGISLAAPYLKERDLRIFTVTDWEIKTVTSYTTIWISATDSTPVSTPSPVTATSTSTAQQEHHHSNPSPAPAQSTSTTSSISVAVPVTTSAAAAPASSAPVSSSQIQVQSTTSTISNSPAQSTSSGTYPVAKIGDAIAADGPCTPGQLCNGDITHFNPSMGLGACGYKDWNAKTIWQDTDYVVAVSANIMGSFSNGGTPDSVNELCKRSVHIKAQDGGQDVVARVVDKCPTCPGNFDLDLSPVVFDKVAPNGDGRVHNVEWYWV